MLKSPSNDPGNIPDAHGDTTYHVARAVAGSQQSLTWIVNALSPLLEFYARRRIPSSLAGLIDPEDLVQMTWATTLPKIGTLEARAGRLTPVLVRFLAKTLLHHCQNLLKRAIRSGVKPISTSDLQALVDEQTSAMPLAILESVENNQILVTALQELPDSYREILVQRALEGRSYDRIAEETGVKVDTLRMRYHRALHSLQSLLPAGLAQELVD